MDFIISRSMVDFSIGYNKAWEYKFNIGRLIGKVEAHTRCDWFIEEVRRDTSYSLEGNHVWCEVIYMMNECWQSADFAESGNASKDLKSAHAFIEFRTWFSAHHVDKSTPSLTSRSKQVITQPSPSDHVIWTRRRSRSFPPCFYSSTCVAKLACWKPSFVTSLRDLACEKGRP